MNFKLTFKNNNMEGIDYKKFETAIDALNWVNENSLFNKIQPLKLVKHDGSVINVW